MITTDKEFTRVTPVMRDTILKRDNYTCYKCGLQMGVQCSPLAWVAAVPITASEKREPLYAFKTICVHCMNNKPSYAAS